MANEAQSAVQNLSSDDNLAARGYKVHRTGKMVPDGRGGLIEQVILEPPGFAPSYAPRPQPATGTIYFVGPKDGPIKIGFAVRLDLRLKDLRTMNAFPLEVWAQIEGPPRLEREYHARFAEHRLHGEWFSPHPDILAEIDRLSA